MQKNLRSLKRIDYEVLHRTGEKVFKEATTQLIEEMSDSEKEADASVKEMQQKSINTTLDDHGKMVLQFESLTDDITDFVDENAVQDIVESLPDLDAAIRRIEEYRSSYRSKLREIKAVLSDAYDDTDSIHMVKLMKNYILQCKEARRRTRGAEDTEKKRVDQVRVDTFSFILSDIKRLVGDLEAVFKVEVTLLEEKNLLERSEDLAEIDKKVGSVSSRITELLSYSSADGKDEWEIRTIKKRYDDLLSSKTAYIFQIKKHISEKELNKEEIFQGSKLNIRLPRFKGYGSSIDIFSFKSKFEKICERSTPRRVMAELLKNNHLEDPAYSLVKYIDDIDEIWARLKEVYGDPRVMLNRKLEEIQRIGQLWKVKDPEKIMDGLQKVINLMKDLMSLSASHDIENELFYGDGLERIFRLLGDRRLTEWLSKTCDKKLSKKASWESVIDFAGREASILQQKVVFFGRNATSKYDEEKKAFIGNPSKLKRPADAPICSICGEAGHVDTSGPSFTRVIQYYSCKKFVDMTPAERFKAVKDKGLCFQCLLPGADAKEGKHKDGSCQHDFVCKHPSHAKYRKKMHVLLCEEHKSNKENQDLLTTYKSRCILKDKNRLPTYSQEIKLSFISSPTKDVQDQSRSDAVTHFTDGGDYEATERAIYQLQRIQVDGQCYTIFYDNGCGDFVSTHDAVCKLGSRATQEHKGPVPIGGVGGIITESQYGIYATSLPLHNGEEAKFSGICLDSITSEFPKYPIDGEVEDDIKQAYQKSGGDPDSLPKLSKYVGGRIDFMIGIKYLRYHPEKVFQLPSGLTIYRSMFRNIDGGRGVIGGPHEVFTAIEKQFYLDSNHVQTFLCNQEKAYRSGYQLNPDVSLLGIKVRTRFKDNDAYVDHSSEAFISQATAMFEETEKVGSEITYRCVKCRSCKECKNAEHIEARSIREEVEEDLIASSVTIDLENRLSMASLPLIYDPVKRLLPNKHSAMKVYTQQVKKLCKNPKDKIDVLKSERKLQDAGFVDYVRNLPEEQQKMLRDSKVQNFIPWRSVWKESSISTPCRIVFDASQITNSGYSLNNILAKGSNNMNVLQEIFIRWSMHAVAIHTDVQKMYNCVKLRQEDWCLQRYIWQEELSPDKQPEEKVIKTLIYGVVSSGNIAERCIRDTAKMFKDEFPEVNEIVQKDLYVDDCISGERNLRLARIRADELEDILNRGGFSLKGVAFSGEKPPESLSNDTETITVAGQKWYTEEDKKYH